MTKDKDIKKRPGKPVWDECEAEGLNEKPDEKPEEKLSRASAKRERARIRGKEDPEKYSDAKETEASAGNSIIIASEIFEATSQRGLSKKGNEKKTAQAKKNAENALKACLKIAKEDKKWRNPGMLTALRREASERIDIPLRTLELYTPTLGTEVAKLK